MAQQCRALLEAANEGWRPPPPTLAGLRGDGARQRGTPGQLTLQTRRQRLGRRAGRYVQLALQGLGQTTVGGQRLHRPSHGLEDPDQAHEARLAEGIHIGEAVVVLEGRRPILLRLAPFAQGPESGQEPLAQSLPDRNHPVVIEIAQEIVRVECHGILDGRGIGRLGRLEGPRVHPQAPPNRQSDVGPIDLEPARAEGLAQAVERVREIAAGPLGVGLGPQQAGQRLARVGTIPVASQVAQQRAQALAVQHAPLRRAGRRGAQRAEQPQPPLVDGRLARLYGHGARSFCVVPEPAALPPPGRPSAGGSAGQ